MRIMDPFTAFGWWLVRHFPPKINVAVCQCGEIVRREDAREHQLITHYGQPTTTTYTKMTTRDVRAWLRTKGYDA